MKLIDGIKRFLRQRMTPLWILLKGMKLILAKESYLNSVGYIESIRQGKPCAVDGSPIPWMNYAVIRFLSERLAPSMTLFEYGSGTSTQFWAAHAGRVFAVEHDARWRDRVQSNLPPNAKLIFRPQEDEVAYVSAIDVPGCLYDVVVVDGLFRDACLDAAVRKLKESGIIVLDDSDRGSLRNGVDRLLEGEFRQLKFRGLKPSGFGEHETSVFYRSGNCLNL